MPNLTLPAGRNIADLMLLRLGTPAHAAQIRMNENCPEAATTVVVPIERYPAAVDELLKDSNICNMTGKQPSDREPDAWKVLMDAKGDWFTLWGVPDYNSMIRHLPLDSN